MGPNPWALALLTVSWSVIAGTTVWCFYRMLTEGRREADEGKERSGGDGGPAPLGDP